jgi:hypothetical protein
VARQSVTDECRDGLDLCIPTPHHHISGSLSDWTRLLIASVVTRPAQPATATEVSSIGHAPAAHRTLVKGARVNSETRTHTARCGAVKGRDCQGSAVASLCAFQARRQPRRPPRFRPSRPNWKSAPMGERQRGGVAHVATADGGTNRARVHPASRPVLAL